MLWGGYIRHFVGVTFPRLGITFGSQKQDKEFTVKQNVLRICDRGIKCWDFSASSRTPALDVLGELCGLGSRLFNLYACCAAQHGAPL